MSELNGHAHLLGAKPRIGTGLAAMPRHLEDDGQFEAESVQVGPNGQPHVNAGRHNFVDATELVEMIRQTVAGELAEVYEILAQIREELLDRKR